SAQNARVFGDTDKREIEQMYRQYARAFVAKDFNIIRECVQAPFVLFVEDVQTLQSMDAVLAFYRNLRGSLEQRGYDHGQIFETRITPLTADRALINTAYRRYK